MPFQDVATSLRDRIIALIDIPELSPDAVLVGDIDKAIENANSFNSQFPMMCVILFNGGSAVGEPSFGGVSVWRHRHIVDFYVPVRDNSDLTKLEEDARNVYYSFIYNVCNRRNRICLGDMALFLERVDPFLETSIAGRNYIVVRFYVSLIQSLE